MKKTLFLLALVAYVASPFVALMIDPSFLLSHWFPSLLNMILGSALVALGVWWTVYVDQRFLDRGPRSVSVLHLAALDFYLIVALGYGMMLFVISFNALISKKTPEDIFANEVILIGMVIGYAWFQFSRRTRRIRRMHHFSQMQNGTNSPEKSDPL